MCKFEIVQSFLPCRQTSIPTLLFSHSPDLVIPITTILLIMSSPLNLAKSHEGGREEVLQALIAGTSSPHAAAEALATISLSYSDREEGVGSTWEAIFHAARNSPKYHQKLVDLLVCISELPSPEDDQGRPIMLHDGRLWSDMPTLGWTAREQWDGASS